MSGPTTLTRVAWTTSLTAPWATALPPVARFVAAAQPLPTMFGTPMVSHALSPRVPAPARVSALVAALRGRLAVVNLPRATRLPPGVAAAVRGLVRAGVDAAALATTEGWEPLGLHPDARHHARVRRSSDSRAIHDRRMTRALLNELPPGTRDLLPADVTWAAIALYESTTPVLRLHPAGDPVQRTGSANAIAIAEIEYRLLIVVGTGAPAGWDALDAEAVTAPTVAWPIPHGGRARRGRAADRRAPWFVVPLLVPDVWFCAHADGATLAEWARLTGRAGGSDAYWFPDTWDRFLEPGRRIGWLTANDVWRPRRGRLPSATVDAGDAAAQTDAVGAWRPPLTLTPDLERGVGVPPGYALVQAVGTLAVGLAVVPD